MNIVIIEDEAFAAEALEKMILDLRPNTKLIERLESVEDAIEWFEENEHPELIFCDIHLSDGSSFEIFREVKVECPVIFTTAFNEYAIEAFKVNSVDYLLKPIKKEDIQKAIEKYENLKKNNLADEMQNLWNLLQNEHVASRNKKKARFMVKSGQSIAAIPSENVAYFMAEEGVVLLVTFEAKRYIVNYTLDELEVLLDEVIFFRANRQLIINIESIKKVNPYFKGRLQLVLSPATEDDPVVSSGKASKFKEWLDL
ncbi:DNA-binding response regulator [Christiangramia fulva]|uniref:DNA-binding response regulator n=1 Tax=Christiangramia fulva TaxID=2126553 RepID=A0A2R3Z5A2_9FLAO|nr:LytTR family DNA-binding domain-containing protein [Christiangramia fulva]AVR45439.1 DNA-binding response regulator [Christiangramia fulva]